LVPAESQGEDFPAASLSHKLVMGLAVGLPFAGCLIAAGLAWRWGLMGWLYVAMLIAGWLATGSGIRVGFHRLLTHRSFETYRWVRLFWMGIGALAVGLAWNVRLPSRLACEAKRL
jgi:stearoyl-CoA desaturase (delta-9 desaturase)